MIAVTQSAVDEAVHIARETLKAYRIGINQALPSKELYVLARAYGKAFSQLEDLTGWKVIKLNAVVVNGMDY